MSNQTRQMGDLELKLRKTAAARPTRTDTDGNTPAEGQLTLAAADCRVLLHEVEKLRALVRQLYKPACAELGAAREGVGDHCSDVLARALARGLDTTDCE